MDFRHLKGFEIDSLVAGGSSCSDWSRVLVAQEFDPAYVKGCTFCGDIRLGRFTSVHTLDGGLRMHSGVYNAILSDVCVGNDVLIRNISGYISSYQVGEGAVIMGCGTIFKREGSVFGCGTQVNVLDETGSRSLRIYPGLTSQMAWLMVFNRDDAFQSAVGRMIDTLCESLRSDRCHIGKGSVIVGCSLIDSVNIGDNVRIDGASHLCEGTVEDSVTLGPGLIMERFIVSRWTSVGGGARISDTFVGEGAIVGAHFCSQHSLIFSSCHFENGEICSAFAGPHTVAHHKSILLIGGMYSFFNAGSGANHSNHLYSLGPRHYGVLERGCKMASDAYVMMPAYIGAYTLILGRHRRHPDTSLFPFSYIIEKKGYSYCMPGAVLAGVGLYRDFSKWPKRDRRPLGMGRDKVNYDLFTPDLCDTMIAARDLLQNALNGVQEYDGVRIDVLEKGDYVIDGLYFTPDSIRRGIRLYGLAVAKALGDALKEVIDEDLIPEDDISFDDWVDVAGMIAPSDAVDVLVRAIADGEISSFDEAEAELARINGNYTAYKASWLKGKLFDSGDEPDSFLSERDRAVEQLNGMIADSARRDLALFHMLDDETPSDDEVSEYGNYLLK